MSTDARQERGLAIANVARIDRKDDGSWLVPSMSGNGRYTVKIDSEKPTCTCPDCENGHKCKHIFAVEFVMKRETTHNADGSTTVTETVAFKATKRPTYAQDWVNYNAAQTHEQDEFQNLLYDLCAGIQNAPQSGRGRPKLPMSDVIFAAVFKVYSTMSGRRFVSDLRAAHADGLVSTLPHYNSIFRYLENTEMTPILAALITKTAKPLAAVESDFALDSSGFATSRFVRWFDHKYNMIRQDHDWVKVHLMCGVKTNVVTAVEILDRNAPDAPQLPALVDQTAKHFTMNEVSADKGYSSINNHEAIANHGATPFIAFKNNTSGKRTRNLDRRRNGCEAWEKAFHYFSLKRDEFLAHYHLRSNVESTFSMIKAKFGDAVRSKTTIAMRNEALCKILCHNICCLISAMYELGIEPNFLGIGKG
jgi:transposase